MLRQKTIDIKQELEKISGIPYDTLMKVKEIEEKATPEQKEKLKYGRATINEIYSEIKQKKKNGIMIRQKTERKIEVIKEAFEIEGQLTLRRIYYILLSKHLINPTKNPQNAYTNLSKQATAWRENGDLDPTIIIDRHRKMFIRPTYSNFEEAFDKLCNDYSRNSMDRQEKYVEVWIEKDTMQDIFLSDCWFKDVPLIISKGFTSFPYKYDAIPRFRKQNKSVIILYFGDFDAEGFYIPECIRRYNESHGFDLDVILKRILLTENDITDLKEFAIEDGGLKKKEHQRKKYVKEYIDKYGFLKYEVEALPFDIVRQKFINALHSHIDLKVVDENEKVSKEDVKDWKKRYLRNK